MGETTVNPLGHTALDKTKMSDEGQWSTSHIILGLPYDTESLRVTLPESKRAGARVLFDSILAAEDLPEWVYTRRNKSAGVWNISNLQAPYGDS